MPALLTLATRRATSIGRSASSPWRRGIKAQVFQSRLVSAGHSWAHDVPEQLKPRLLAAAAFALEIEVARAERGDWPQVGTNACNGRCVIEWACVILRARGQADDAERLWHLVMIALTGGVRDWTFLVSPLAPSQRPETGHLVHARAAAA